MLKVLGETFAPVIFHLLHQAEQFMSWSSDGGNSFNNKSTYLLKVHRQGHSEVCVCLFVHTGYCVMSSVLLCECVWMGCRMCYCLRGRSSSCLSLGCFLPSTHFPSIRRQGGINQTLCFMSSPCGLVSSPFSFLTWKSSEEVEQERSEMVCMNKPEAPNFSKWNVIILLLCVIYLCC